MKMLGQDLHTQQEFDKFHADEFAPLVTKVAQVEEAATKATKLLAIAGVTSIVALLTSIGSVVIALALTMPK